MKKTKTVLKKLSAILLAVAMLLPLTPQVGNSNPLSVDASNAYVSTIETWRYDLAPVYNDNIYNELKDTHIKYRCVGRDTATMSIGPLFRADYHPHTQMDMTYNGGNEYNMITGTKVVYDGVGRWENCAWNYSQHFSDETVYRIGANKYSGGGFIRALTSDGSHLGTARGGYIDINHKKGVDYVETYRNLETPYVVAIDNKKPEITGVSMSSFGEVTLYFSELLRPANGGINVGEYTISLSYADANSGVEIGVLQYRAVSFEDKEMRFQLISSEPAQGEYRILSVNGLTNGAEDETFDVFGVLEVYAFARGQERYPPYNLIMEYVRNPLTFIGTVGGCAPVTDLAGNALAIPARKDIRGYGITIDNKRPEIEKISMTGSMAVKLNEQEKDSWPELTDASSLWAGTDGDELYFHLQFSELMQHVGGVVLNVQKDGESVKLGSPRLTKSVNAMGDTCTVATYGPFKAEAGMTMAEGHENSSISVIGTEGYFADCHGNSLDGGTKSSAQKIYLDVTPPKVTASLYSGNGTRDFSIKLEMSDEGSGFIGLSGGTIGLSATVESKVSYIMAITDTVAIPSAEHYVYSGTLDPGGTSFSHNIPLYSGTRYIHIKLVGADNSITVDELRVEYSIPDAAGNRNTTDASTVEPNYSFDETPPKVNDLSASVGYTADSAYVNASWKASDYNQTDGMITYYQWSDTRPADYSTGWVSLGEQKDGFAWTLPESGQPKLESGTAATFTLWVYAADKSGNKSEMYSKTVEISLVNPNYSSSTADSVEIPTLDPSLKLSVNASQDGEKDGYMRVFVEFLENDGKDANYSYVYSFILSSDDMTSAIDVFPLTASGLSERSVYKTKLNDTGTEFTSVSTISMADLDALLKAWYGEVRVTFDLAFGENAAVADNALIPEVGALSAKVTDGSYCKPDEEILFFQSCDIEDIYTLAFSGHTAADGESFTEKAVFYQTLYGMGFNVTINNIYRADRGVSDIDFSESFVSVIKLNADGSLGETVATVPLSTAAEQGVTLPDVGHETAVFAIRVTLTMKDGQSISFDDSIRLVVDNVLTELGVTETYVTPNLPFKSHSALPYLIRFDENGMPYLREASGGNNSIRLYDDTPIVIYNKATDGYIDNMSVSVAGQRESIRTDTYTNEVGGALNFGFSVTAKNAEQVIEGLTVGKIDAIYIWNPAVHDSREEGIIYSDGYSYTYNSENALDHYTWTYDETTGIGTSVPNKTEAGVYTMAELIGLADGDNTICYQLVMANGIESPIGQFTICANAETPSASLGMDVLEEKTNVAAEGEPINVARADIYLQSIFSNSDIIGSYYLTKDQMGLVEFTEGEDGIVETYTETDKYDRYDTLGALVDGYYEQWQDISLIYDASDGKYYNIDGRVIDGWAKDHLYHFPSVRDYYLYDVDPNATVRLKGSVLSTYMTGVSGEGNVTNKIGRDVSYSASGAFLIVDESGACAMVFPQLAACEGAYSTVDVAGYQPKYRLTEDLVEFESDFSMGYMHNGSLELNARINYTGDYVDPDVSYVIFTDADGKEIERFYLNGTIYDPNPVGFDRGQVSNSEVTLELINPLADGVNHQTGDLVESVWAQLVLFDSNTGREVRSNVLEVTHSERIYENPVPEPYWTDYYDGLRLHWDTSVILNEHSNFNHHLNIFEDGDHVITVTDHFGVTQTVTVTTTHFAQFQPPKVVIDNTEKTTKPVTVTITVPEGAGYDSVKVVSDDENVTVVGSETDTVIVTFNASATATVSWSVPNGDTTEYRSYDLNISNILPYELGVIWDYGDDPADYSGGDVFVRVYDKTGNWDIIDPMTGKAPVYVFVYGSEVTEYTFPTLSNGEILENGLYNDIGEFTIALEVTLKDVPSAPEVTVDTRAPSVQILPYSMRRQEAVSRECYLIYEDLDERVQSGEETYIDILNPSLLPYDGYTEYTDAEEFVESLGWASRFRFNIEVQDINRTRIVIKSGLYADAPASYLTAASDVIEGVSLLGNVLEVTGPAQFTIFVIDECNNVTAFSMDLYNVGNAPVPAYTKLPASANGANAIRITLSTPEDGEDLIITAVDGKAMSNAVFTENGSYTVSYSYVYKGEPVEGAIRINVIEIDNEKPYLVKKKWSVSSGLPTQNDVTLTLTFSKPIEVARIGLGAAEIPEQIRVLAVGNTVTLRYSDNCEALEFYFMAFNGMWSDLVEIEALDAIDRTAPVITVGEIVYSDDARSATVTFTANETVSFRESGSVGTEFFRKLGKNGSYEYTFMDAAGNSTAVTVDITGIVDTQPTLSFSKNPDGSGSVADPDGLGDVTVGDVFYVSVDRDATVSFNGEMHNVLAGEWLRLTVGDRSGGSIYAKDAYGNSVGAVFTSIGYPDLMPPHMELLNYVIRVSLLDLSGLDEAIKENALAVDDRDGNVTVYVDYDTPTAAGDYTVTYTARDSAGNETVMTGILRVSEGAVAGVLIDGDFVERESIYLATGEDDLILSVNMASEPYSVSWVKGIRTAAQMKIGANELDGFTGEGALPFAGESGYYTILVTTQSHDNYRIIVYIK